MLGSHDHPGAACLGRPSTSRQPDPLEQEAARRYLRRGNLPGALLAEDPIRRWSPETSRSRTTS